MPQESATKTYNTLTNPLKSKVYIRPTRSIGNQTEQEWKQKVHEYGTIEKKNPTFATDYAFHIDRLESARLQRDMPTKYFDDMDFVTDFHTNENLKNTYLQKKMNDSEIRVNMGTAEKKIEAIYNELLALNMQHEIRAYDTDDYELVELGRDFTDIVTRTNKIEEDDDFWQEAVFELLTQRAVFIEELFLDIPTRNNTRRIRKAIKRIVSGLKVYLGDINLPLYRINEQPYIVKYDLVHWRTAFQMYGHLPNFQCVMSQFQPNSQYKNAFAYRFGEVKNNQCEIITYTSLPDNEQNVYVNGVPMYDYGSPQTQIPWDFEGYNLQGFCLKTENTDFAYGRPMTASAKSLASLQNEMIRSLLRKFFQSMEPPLAVRGDKTFSKDIWEPGATAHGVKKDDFERLIDHEGPTSSEFAMYDLVERKVEEFIGASNISQGLAPQDRATATEVQNMQTQAAKMLGLAVAAIIRMKREMTKLRIYTIFDHHLSSSKSHFSPITQKEERFFAGFSAANVMLDNERRGTKRIEFIDRDLSRDEKMAIKDYEDQQAKIGKQIRLKTVNTPKLKNLFLHWYVIVTPKQREGTMMDRLTFKDKFINAQAISEVTGSPLNKDKVVEDFENKWDATDWFQKQAPVQLEQPLQPGEEPLPQNDFKDMRNRLESLKNSQFSNGQIGGSTQMKLAKGMA